MRNFSSIKQMQRVAKKAGEKAATEYLEKNKAEEKEKALKLAKERKLKARMEEEQARITLAPMKEENPRKYRAMKELYRLWANGKIGFVKHLAENYCTGKAAPLKEGENLHCALTRAKLFSQQETFNKLDELSKELLEITKQKVAGEFDSKKSEDKVQQIMEGKVLGFTGPDTDTALCSEAIEGLAEFCSAKVLVGELNLGTKRKKAFRGQKPV